MAIPGIRPIAVSGLLAILAAAGRAPTPVAGVTQNTAQAPAGRGAQPPGGRGGQTQGGRGASAGAQEALDRLGIVGYADHMTVQPGETVKFLVSSQSPRYRADIVRLIHGDANPKGPGMKEPLVETAANREYQGKRQPLPLGSYATVADNAALRLTGSLSIAAWIAPTRHDPQAPGGSAPNGDQGIVTKWSATDQTGYGLYIEDAGRGAVWLGAEGRVEQAGATGPARPG